VRRTQSEGSNLSVCVYILSYAISNTRSVSVCLSVCFLFVLAVCLCLPVHQAWGEAPVVRVQWTVVGGVRPPGGATLALPLLPFAEQLALGFNPSPAAAVGGGCRYARGGRFAPNSNSKHPSCSFCKGGAIRIWNYNKSEEDAERGVLYMCISLFIMCVCVCVCLCIHYI